jgi:hypothetical protein
MPTFDVTCYHSISGRLIWSQTQEAKSPAHAIAQACLPTADREAWTALHQGATHDLCVGHPADRLRFDVQASLRSLK